MRGTIPSVLLLATALAPRGLAADGRTVLSLETGWTFEGQSVDGSSRRETVSLPHTWNARDAQAGLAYQRGTGTYTRALPIDASMRGWRVFLKLGGANAVADVEVNGRLAGQHRGGYSAFVFEITPLVRPGEENAVTVRVNNERHEDVLPLAGDFNIYGGLHRPAWLVTTGPVCISPLDHASPGVLVRQPKVTGAEAAIEVTTLLSNGGASTS